MNSRSRRNSTRRLTSPVRSAPGVELLRGGAVLSLGIAVTRLAPLAVLAVVLLDGEPRQYGQYAMSLGIVTILMIGAESGISILATSKASIDLLSESALAAHALRQGFVCYGICVALGLAIARRTGFEDSLPMTAALGLMVILNGPAALVTARLQRLQRYRCIMLTQVAAGLVGAAVGLTSYFVGAGVWALVWQAVATSGLTQVLVILPRRNRIPVLWRALGSAPPHQRELNHALTANVVGVVGRRGDQLMIGTVLGASALGHYALAGRILMLITEIGLHPLERVTTRQLGQERNDRAAALRMLAANQRRVVSIFGPVFVAAASFSLLAIPAFLGHQWQPAAWCAALLCVAGSLQASYNLTFCAVYVLDSSQRALRFQVTQIACFVLPTTIGMALGVVGAAAGYALGSFVAFALARSYIRHLWQSLDSELPSPGLGEAQMHVARTSRSRE